MRFHCLLYVDRGIAPPSDTPARYDALREAMIDAGVLVASGQLQSADATKVVRIDAGHQFVSDGALNSEYARPVGYFLFECRDEVEAIAWAMQIPAAEYGSVELTRERPVRAGAEPEAEAA